MMTTLGSDTSNKTALRASLKKEDESLGERLAATEGPLVVPAEADVSAALPPAGEAPVTPLGQTLRAESAGKRRSATGKATAKPADKTAAAKAVPPAKATKGAAARAAKGAAAAKTTGQAASQGEAPKAGRNKPTAGDAEKLTGKKAAKPARVVEKIEKVAKEKRDKLVRLSVELLKSEAAAIETIRAELAKAAGWAASRSDILRAGARLFAGQQLEQMKALLDGLATMAAGKGKKKG